jgi:predicted tellurium resistance membrane protein TerC
METGTLLSITEIILVIIEIVLMVYESQMITKHKKQESEILPNDQNSETISYTQKETETKLLIVTKNEDQTSETLIIIKEKESETLVRKYG